MAAAAFAYRSKQNSSDSDSDDSDQECRDWKRATRKKESPLEKIPIDPPPTETQTNPSPEDKAATTKRKRNNIWCEVLEDQILSESLNHCGVKQKPKDYGNRGEESYDYTLARKFHKKEEDSDEDGSEEDMSDSTETSSVVSSVREKFHHNKYVKLDSAGTEAARKIVKTLGEQKPYLIFRIVKFIGIEKAMQLLKMTEEIEENGGMMINNNLRRRTPGGVYFQLLKSDKDVDKSVVARVFEGELNSFQVKRLYDERRKYKKKLAAIKAAEKAALKAAELPLPITFPQPELKQEENAVKMEEDSMLEVQPAIMQDPTPSIQESKGSDLEDGEIGD